MKFKYITTLFIVLLTASCGKSPSCNHIDDDHNHNCDICGIKLTDHVDENSDHDCDICREALTTCVDNDHNHYCDICKDKLSDHIDNDHNHICDICETTMGVHEDTNNDHLCEYCGQKVSEHVDNNNDHICDICQEKCSDHVDNNKDDQCDICGLNMNFSIYATFKDSSYSITSGIELVSDPYELPELYTATVSISEGTQILIQDNLKIAYKSYKTDINVKTDAFANSVVTVNSNNSHLLFHAYGKVVITYDSSKSEQNITVTIDEITSYQTCESLSGSSSKYYKSILFVATTGKPGFITYSFKETTYKFTNKQYIQIRANCDSVNGLRHFTLGPNTNTSYFEVEELAKSSCLTYKGKDTYTFSLTVTVEIGTYNVVLDIAKTN